MRKAKLFKSGEKLVRAVVAVSLDNCKKFEKL